MSGERHNLLGMTLDELASFAESIGERRFRGRQLFGWLYARGATGFQGMTDLGRELRGRLEAAAMVRGLETVALQTSADGTVKFLFALADGLKVESVLIPPASAFRGAEAAGEDEQKRLTLCVSTQVGCPLECAFCATATMGFHRNLTSGEIVDQVLRARRHSGRKITNLVFMGMGEPLLNYDAVMRAAGICTDGLSIAQRRITVSTAGWADGILRMAAERRRMKLAVSLHSAVEATRAALMPITRRFPLERLLAAVGEYYRRTRLRVTYEVIFFDGVNDADSDVGELVRLARRVPCKINVIPFHSIVSAAPAGPGATLRRSRRTEEIVGRLRDAHLTVMVRSSAGEDIDAACGQLAVRLGRPARRRTPAAVPA